MRHPSGPRPDDDRAFMHCALALGARGLGQCWPNPSVGCVLVKNGQVLATAHTAAGGRPHAETQALAAAGSAAQGATAYLTLEPCAHHGQTPPCAEALVQAGIRRVVIACSDPDPRVAGKGSTILHNAGIEVITGMLEDEAMRQHAGFFSRIARGRPYLAMKLATSLDGRITNHHGQSQWITGEEARAYGHHLRASHDAILTGIGTVLADDPALTCRIDGLAHRSPVRVVLDSQLRLPLHSALAKTARDVPVWLLTTAPADAPARQPLEEAGIRIATLPATNGLPSLAAALGWLAEQGITRVLAEGGSTLNASLWHSGLVDRYYWFRAPVALGSSGAPAIDRQEHTAPSALPRLQREEVIPLGSDLLEIYSGTP